MLKMLILASKVALPDDDNDHRRFWVGAVGIRRDGTIVFSKNGAVFSTSIENYHLIPSAHAEGRVLKKMDFGGVLYVARMARKDRSLQMAKPCNMCRIHIKAKKIKKVYYTINSNQFGVWYPKTDKYIIFSKEVKNQ